MIQSVICFLLGICTLHFFPSLPSFYLPIIIIIITSIVIVWIKPAKYILIFALGFLWVLWNASSHLQKNLPKTLENIPLTLIGYVASLPEKKGDSVQFDFEVKQSCPKRLWQNPGKIRLRCLKPTCLLGVGDELQVTVKLKPEFAYSNPGSFDSERHFFQNRLNAKGYLLEKYPIKKISSDIWHYPIERLRYSIDNKIKQALSLRPLGGLINALVVGTREGISVSQWTVFKNTGTAHLMAISGLHIGLVASMIFFVVNFLWRRLPIVFLRIPSIWLGSIAGLIGAFSYSLLAGFSIPTQRALVMIVVFMSGTIFRRVRFVWHHYFLALGIVLLIDPLATLNIGFWLSFGAVGILLYGMGGRLQPKGLWWRWGRAQWIIFLGIMPLTMAFFQQLSLVSPLANIIAIPWVSLLVVPMALLGTSLISLPTGIAFFFLNLSEFLLEIIWPLLLYLSELNHATLPVHLDALVFIPAMLAVLILLLPPGFPAKGLGLVWMLPLFFPKSSAIKMGEVQLTVLDVGQGLSAIIETEKHLLVFDTGPKLNEEFDAGNRVILPYLLTKNKNKIDTLMISHGDNDHIGGMNSILNKTIVDRIITSEPEKIPRKSELCWQAQHWHWDGVDFEIIHPETLQTKKRNDHCCVLRVKTKNHSILLTGDIEAKSEQKIVHRQGMQLKSTLLLVPHHGSKTSSTMEFIQAVNPQYAIIPVGYKNPYGHPHKEILERYRQLGIPILDTIHSGAIRFLIKEEDRNLTPHQHRMEHLRYWHTSL